MPSPHTNKLRVFWAQGPRPGNAGDIFTPWLLDRCGVSYQYVKPDASRKLLASGSILVLAKPHDVVWGSGVNELYRPIASPLDVRAVRGPLTRCRLLELGIDCPAIYGDPALLAPRFYCRPVEKKHCIGILPHYVDRRHGCHPPGHIIDILGPLTQTIDAIRECEFIMSSTLHGLILAHAYGIPARWCQWSDRIFGDGTKYRDYLLSVGIEPYPPHTGIVPVDMIRRELSAAVRLDLDLEPLWSARPWAAQS